MAAFSLNGSKNLPGGEGGLFVTDDDTFKFEADKVRGLGEIIEEDVERDYDAYEIGWMYRYQEMAAAFVRARLKTLDADNAVRRENAEHLSLRLGGMKGIKTPSVPEDRTSAWHLYRLRIDPRELGLNVSANEFRAKVQKALRAEGVQANRWQNRPVPMQRLFQDRSGYGKGCPWSCPFGSAADLAYRQEDYPVTQAVVDDSIVMHDAIYPPNGKELMNLYAATYQKLWDNLDEIMDVSLLKNAKGDPV